MKEIIQYIDSEIQKVDQDTNRRTVNVRYNAGYKHAMLNVRERLQEYIEAENDEIEGVVDFANKLAKVLKGNGSSTALFFVQQAYPDEIDAPSDQPSSDVILDNIITQSELWTKNHNL